MNRIDRLTAIMVQLQSKRVVTAREIADRFDISIRTVYRDIRALEKGGVPIGAEAGRGYFIMEGYYLPPVTFTTEEAGAMLLGGKLIEKHSDESVKMYFNEALLKVKAVLRFKGKDQLESLEDHIRVLGVTKPVTTNFPNNFLSDIQIAIVQKSLLQFEYFSQSKSEFTQRIVEPSGLCYYGGHWHFIAYCRMREDFRDFRVDRISKLLATGEKFAKDRKDDFQNFIQKVILGSSLEEVKLSIDQNTARYVIEQKYLYGFVGQEEQDDRILMTFMTPSVNYFARWLLMYGSTINIISPQRLKDKIVELVKELNEHHLK